jgi:hypothetical protein
MKQISLEDICESEIRSDLPWCLKFLMVGRTSEKVYYVTSNAERRYDSHKQFSRLKVKYSFSFSSCILIYYTSIDWLIMAAPRVGIGVFVFRRDGTFVLGKRKGSLGAGKYSSHRQICRKVKDFGVLDHIH